MTILDIAKVQPCITLLDVTAREDCRFIHEWIVGETAKVKSTGMRYDVISGRVSVFPIKINYNGEPNKRGMPEMGWGLNEKEIPKEILRAEVTSLHMRCSDGITYSVRVDIELPSLQAEKVLAEWNPQVDEEQDEES